MSHAAPPKPVSHFESKPPIKGETKHTGDAGKLEQGNDAQKRRIQYVGKNTAAPAAAGLYNNNPVPGKQRN